MSYRGNSEQEALKSLTQNVRERLEQSGLSSTYFEAIAQSRNHTGLMLNIDDNETSSQDKVRAWVIIGEEINKFYRERYGM